MNRFKRQCQQEQQQAKAEVAVADGADGDGGPDEEEDYMSEAFLEQLQRQQHQQSSSLTKSGKRPKPSSSAAAPPAPPLSRKAKQQAAEEKLQEGLNTPLSEDNVGLRLLKLMGFKAGRGLGKSAKGIAEPLSIVRRQGREGIGTVERQQEHASKLQELGRLRAEWAEKRKADFAQAMSSKFAERRVAGKLVRAMKAVETLDVRAGRPRSCLWWSSEREEGERAEEEQEHEQEEQGENVGGIEVDDKCGMSGAVVATAASDEGKQRFIVEGAGDGREDEDDLWPSLVNAEKLSLVTAYLRTEYSYCVYCGHQYEGPEELGKECPGEAEQDH